MAACGTSREGVVRVTEWFKILGNSQQARPNNFLTESAVGLMFRVGSGPLEHQYI